MIRDPFYREITGRLEGPLDPDLFEQCAADLLRAVYPTLTPMRGGTDAGMDGAIADGAGEPFPLVATTGKDVIENLTRNLKSYLGDEGRRRKVVLATSKALTPTRKRNLYRRAEEYGFTLINVHDQDAMANLLYRAPEWCMELLNLTGAPPALSVVPLTERPLLNQELIGRNDDLSWMHQIDGDSLLAGQPGSGKTFLLHNFAMGGGGLFVVSRDRGGIAASIRSEQPPVVIVDDAAVAPQVLVDLRQMRAELGAEFLILASCWLGDKETIAHTLNVPDARVHSLDPLTRDEIVEVVKATGLYGPNELIREIVDQAEGRPGLAVTLAYLCLQGGVRQVALGDALSELFLRFFEPIAGQTVSAILAAFSIGGDAGMTMEAVAATLGLNTPEVWQAAHKLAAGGVIKEVNQQCLSVRPPALRDVLVGKVFFAGAMSLPIELEQLLAEAPDLSEVAATLVGARSRGADVPQELLTRILERTPSPNAWEAYAWLGHDETVWVLNHHPERLITIARAALHRAPDTAIPILLNAAIGDHRQLHSTPDHTLRLIQDWIHAGRPGTGEAPCRRKNLLEVTLSWVAGGGDPGVSLRAFQFALAPGFADHVADPGMGVRITLRRGYLQLEELLAVQGLWPQVLDAMRVMGIPDWEPVRHMVEAWAYPGRVNVEIPLEMYEAMQLFAGQMLHDLVVLAEGRYGIHHWIKQTAEHLGLEVEIPTDRDFQVLYPRKDAGFENWRAAHNEQMLAVRELANQWAQLDPAWVVNRIVLIEQEALLADITWPRWTPFLCTQIAESIDFSIIWVRAMIDADASSDLVGPFLERAVRTDEPGWIELAIECLDRPMLAAAAITLALTLPDPPEDLLLRALARLEGYASLVSALCIRNRVAEGVLRSLLHHDNTAAVSAAARGEWSADPEGIVRDSLQEDWQDAIINRVTDDYLLSKVLEDDPALAFGWLQVQLRKDDSSLLMHQYGRAVVVAVGALDVEARRQILEQVPESYGMARLVASLVDRNPGLYSELLRNERLRPFHLAPLSGSLEGAWIELAQMAVDAGYSSEEVALAVHRSLDLVTVEWSGSESAMWAGWVDRFEQLCSHEDQRVQEVGRIGKAHAEEQMERARGQEWEEAVYGLRW